MVCRLLGKVEVTTTPRVASHARNVLPVSVVTAHVVVNQVLFKKSGAKTPVTIKLIDQSACGYLSTSIAHPPGRNQLTHECVYKREIRISSAPPRKITRFKRGPTRLPGYT